MKFQLILGIFVFLFIISNLHPVFAQTITLSPSPTISSPTTSALQNTIVTITHGEKGSKDIEKLFSRRPAKQLNYTNFIAYFIQYAVQKGVPVDSIMLILFIPILATMVVFFRYIIGLTTLGTLLSIVLAITFLSTGIVFGIILLSTILLASIFSQIILKQIRIMQLAKVALSMIVVSVFIFVALLYSVTSGVLLSSQISIYPILLYILLSESIIAIQLERSGEEAFWITVITILLGIMGFFLLSTPSIRDTILLYPELLLLLIPINLLIGRYFGLRLTEYFRFVPNMRHANK